MKLLPTSAPNDPELGMALELSLERLEIEMERRRAADRRTTATPLHLVPSMPETSLTDRQPRPASPDSSKTR